MVMDCGFTIFLLQSASAFIKIIYFIHNITLLILIDYKDRVLTVIALTLPIIIMNICTCVCACMHGHMCVFNISVMYMLTYMNTLHTDKHIGKL